MSTSTPPKKPTPRIPAYRPSRSSRPTAAQSSPLIHDAQSNIRRVRLPLFFGGLFAISASFYGTLLYQEVNSTAPPPPVIEVLDTRPIYNDCAEDFDSSVGLSETIGFIWVLRRRIARAAEGHVLESAVGTGRNSEYYDMKRCKSITFVDRSEGMLDVAMAKWKELKKGSGFENRARWKVGDAARLDLKPPQAATKAGSPEMNEVEGFDTIVQTMGLCSTPDPVGLLKNLGRLVKPSDADGNGGRILLLEHGKGHYGWINTVLDRGAGEHAKDFGCWWNRDIGDIAERSGLEVVDIKRYYFGTTWWVELKRKSLGPNNEKQEAIKMELLSKQRETKLVTSPKQEAGMLQPPQQPVEVPHKTKSWWEVWK